MNLSECLSELQLACKDEPMDNDGKGAWWLSPKKKEGRYAYVHDHLGDATEQLDKLQDKYWAMRKAVSKLLETVAIAQQLHAELKFYQRNLPASLATVDADRVIERWESV